MLAPPIAIFVCIATPVAVAAREPIVRALPRSAILFAAIGLPVNLTGVTLSDVTSGVAPEGDATVLLVEGRLANAGGKPARTPRIDLTIRSDAGDVLYRWSVKAPRPELGPGETAAFSARLASPPPLGRHVRVTFAREGEPAVVASR